MSYGKELLPGADRDAPAAGQPAGWAGRSGARGYEPIRDLLETWVGGLPVEHRAGVVSNLVSGDETFESALWELYLYAVATGSSDRVKISTHPVFLVHGAISYHLEAVAVGRSPEHVAADRRLQDLEAVLDQVRIDGATLMLHYHRVWPRPVRAAKLRDQLVRWTASLDTARLASQTKAFQVNASHPTFPFEDDGWILPFEALPMKSGTSRGAPLIRMRGAAGAKGVYNTTGLRRALNSKANNYGTRLPYPLVTAALSNTEFPTREYDVSAVLYGLSALPPASVVDPADLHTNGHWRTTNGWRRSHRAPRSQIPPAMRWCGPGGARTNTAVGLSYEQRAARSRYWARRSAHNPGPSRLLSQDC